MDRFFVKEIDFGAIGNRFIVVHYNEDLKIKSVVLDISPDYINIINILTSEALDELKDEVRIHNNKIAEVEDV